MEFLEYVTGLLTGAGIRAGEEYPAGRWLRLQVPGAAVGLGGVDFEAGMILVRVKVLSPRTLGGWACQNAALEILAILHGAGLPGQMGEMEFLEGSDSFCIPIDLRLSGVFGESWSLGQRWTIRCGGTVLEQVEDFRAVRDQERRVIGASCQAQPVGVSPGHGAWVITLTQNGGEDVQQEPFVLTLEDGQQTITYSGCHWNREEWRCHQGGLKRVRTGFALGREVQRGG